MSTLIQLSARCCIAALFSVLFVASTAWTEDASQDAPAPSHTLQLAEGATSPEAQIAQLGWLAGYWRGTGLGGECEEIWSAPRGDRMVGTFAMRQEGKTVFSEHMTIVEEAGSLVMKVKHFSNEFVSWEEKDEASEFPLVRLESNAAYFAGLTVRRDGDKLEIWVKVGDENGSKEERFDLARVAF